MSSLTLLAAVAPTRLDPIRPFLDADIVVQLVMAGLLLARIWVWMIIVSFSLRMRKLRNSLVPYGEQQFTRQIPYMRPARLYPFENRKCWRKGIWQPKKCGAFPS